MFRSLSITLLTLAGSLVPSSFATAQNPGNPDFGNWRGPCYNCYNYALNRKDWFFAQTLDVVAPAKITCANAKAAAIADGLAPAAWAGPPAAQPGGWPAGACPPGHSLVALAVIPCNIVNAIRKIPGKKFALPSNADFVGDFHWYRLNGDGTVANPWEWSHKRGQTPATNRDAGGNVMNAALPPHLANLGIYEFCCYMCVPNPPAALGPVNGSLPWTPEEIVRAWRLRGTGLEDLQQDILDLQGTLQHLPSLQPVPDPLWPDFQDPRGFGLMLPPSLPSAPPYLRVFDGVVGIYSDLEGDQFTQIQYFADDNGLEDFLKLQFDDLEVDFFSQGCHTSLGLLEFTMIGGDAQVGGFIDFELQPYDPVFPGVVHIGLDQIALPLTIIGLAPDCLLLTTPILALPLQPLPLLPGGELGFPIPPDPNLAGIELQCQGLLIDPLVPGGVATSGGLTIEVK